MSRLEDVFAIRRPPLSAYAVVAQPQLIVETYRSARGEMISLGRLHRVSINRTSHARYCYRLGEEGPVRRIVRPRFTLCLQPAGVPLFVEGDAADYISIFLDPALFERMAPGFRPAERPAERLLAPTDPVIRHLALALAEMTRSPEAVDPLTAEQAAAAFAAGVARLLDGTAPARTEAEPALPAYRLRRVLGYIEAALDEARPDAQDTMAGEALSLARLAAVAGLSPSHFSRAFKAATGAAPHRFVLERRVDRARALLDRTGLPLAQIAYEAGFASQSHFTAAFRRVVGMTPGAYRRRL